VRGPALVLIVDADIAQAAGPEPKSRPWSEDARTCHELLNAIWKRRGYQAAFDAQLRKEWKEHQGGTGRAWFARMLSARRLQKLDPDTTWIASAVRDALPEEEHESALKDKHLIALAHDSGDERVLSNDSKARSKYCRVADTRVARVHWVAASDESIRWLTEGAPEQERWRLGYEGTA